jgi:hypothetical protein
MKIYNVTYKGNASRFRNFEREVIADSEREAVEKIFGEHLDSNYFPQNDGSIKDCDGHEVASATDDVIEYDGGYFSAEEIIEDEEL